jgi:hypothetical protein
VRRVVGCWEPLSLSQGSSACYVAKATKAPLWSLSTSYSGLNSFGLKSETQLSRNVPWHETHTAHAESESLAAEMMSLGLPYDIEPSGFLVSEQKLVDLDGLVNGLVLVLNELRLVVPECQNRATGTFAQQFVFFPVDDPPAQACADKNSNTVSAIFFTEFLVSVCWNKETYRELSAASPRLLRRFLLVRPYLRPPRSLRRRDLPTC